MFGQSPKPIDPSKAYVVFYREGRWNQVDWKIPCMVDDSVLVMLSKGRFSEPIAINPGVHFISVQLEDTSVLDIEKDTLEVDLKPGIVKFFKIIFAPGYGEGNQVSHYKPASIARAKDAERVIKERGLKLVNGK